MKPLILTEFQIQLTEMTQIKQAKSELLIRKKSEIEGSILFKMAYS